jgi:serine protease Do
MVVKTELSFLLNCSLSLLIFFSLVSPGLGAPTSAEIYQSLHDSSFEVLLGGQLRGSGWFAGGEGVGITAAHILKGSGQVEVVSPRAGRLKAKILSQDLRHDLALLKIERLGGFFPVLELAETFPRVGEHIYCFGAALNRHQLFFEGILARAQTQYEWNELNQIYTEVYPVGAMTPVGLSGAPWVNAAGQVIGVQSGMMARENELMGMAFISPLEPLHLLLKTRKGQKTVFLGGTLAEPWEVPADSGGASLSEGLRILKLYEGGALEFAGVREGEIIFAVEDRAVSYRDDLLRLISQSRADARISLSVGRERGQRREVVIPLVFK